MEWILQHYSWVNEQQQSEEVFKFFQFLFLLHSRLVIELIIHQVDVEQLKTANTRNNIQRHWRRNDSQVPREHSKT